MRWMLVWAIRHQPVWFTPLDIDFAHCKLTSLSPKKAIKCKDVRVFALYNK